MRTALKILVALALVGAVGWGLWALFPGDERAIRKQLRQLAGLASFTGEESNLRRLTTASAIAHHFTLDTRINVTIPGVGVHTFRGRTEVQETALAALARGWTAEVEFHDLIVTLAPDKESAVVDLTATISTGSERNAGLQELRFQMRKEDSGWQIEQLDTLQTFR